MLIVLDASTLILLAKVDLLQIVAQRTKVVIPTTVENEALAKPEAYDARLIAQMLKDGRIQVSEESSSNALKEIRRQFRLDAGEAISLWMAKEEKAVLGIDDGPGIQAAKILGIPFFTALQILVALYQEGLLDAPSAMAKLESLERWGRYQVRLIEDARSRIQKER